ncbi:MAG: YerC/YecD family TrpR-related protein [Patescibacteria group bacterium]|nr:YerC/YecD family TrpR-related protein [Patescibacteria group bacterium]
MRSKPFFQTTTKNYKPRTRLEKQLVQSFVVLKSATETANFLRDLLTPAEIEEFSNRLEIAFLLRERKLSYVEIAERVGTSTTTVTRVAQWLFRGCGGYQTVLDRMKPAE